LSPGTALTWSVAGRLIDLSPEFLTDVSFSSATECERHTDLAGSDHRPKPGRHRESAVAGYRLTGFGADRRIWSAGDRSGWTDGREQNIRFWAAC
jgi:hypothetical protein